MRILAAEFQRITDLRVSLEDGYCQQSELKIDLLGSENHGSFLLTITMCQCPDHIPGHIALLKAVVQTGAGGSNSGVRQVILEDYLLGVGCFLSAETLDTLLGANKQLDSLQFHHVDLSRIPLSCLAKVGVIQGLKELAFDQCCQNKRAAGPVLTDRLLTGITCVSQNIRQVQVTRCQSVTDRLLKQLATHCRQLWYADFSGCPKVTAKGVAQFCYCLGNKEADMSFLKIVDTDVRGNILQRYLMVPVGLGSDGNQRWICTKLEDAEFGWASSACCIQDRQLPNKSLVIFV